MNIPKLFGVVVLSGLTIVGATIAEADRAPVIFCHGMGMSPQAYETDELRALFRQQGHELLVARTPTVGTIAEHADALASEVRRLVPRGPYHLLAHSMGGLDARLAIFKHGLGDRALSLTTIATPHRGSSIADFVVFNTGLGTKNGQLADRFIGYFGRDPRAVRNLTTNYVTREFNPQVKDDPRVRYFSMTFFIPPPAAVFTGSSGLWLSNNAMAAAGDLLNDGLVSVGSAAWGEVIMTAPCDHAAETFKAPFLGCDHRKIFAKALTNLDRF